MDRRTSTVSGVNLALFALFVSNFCYGMDVTLNKDKGHVDFHAVGKPGIIKIHGKGEGPTGKLSVDTAAASAKIKGVIHFQMSTLDTENNMRNDHMKNKYLEIAKFPEALLDIKQLTVASDFFQKKDGSLSDVSFNGDLTLHGVTKPVTGTFKISNHGDNVDGEAHFETKISDFGIAVPSFSGITVADEVKLDVGFQGQISK